MLALKNPDAISSDKKFSWKTFLEEWDGLAKLAAADALVKHGIGGPPAYGIREMIAQIADRDRVNMDEIADLMTPINAPMGTENGWGQEPLTATLLEGKRRIEELQKLLISNLPESYEWQIVRNGGLSFLPVDDTEIRAAERRLKCTLPPTYVEFLRHSNGWITSVGKLVAVSQLSLLNAASPDYVREWDLRPRVDVEDEDYFVYGPKQYPYTARTEYLYQCIQLAVPFEDTVNERLLLNPEIVFSDGEWEVWYMSPRISGAIRYQSLVGLMELLRNIDLKTLSQLASGK